MRHQNKVGWAILVSAVALSAAPARAQYRVRDLGGTDFTLRGKPYAVNAHGHVAGAQVVSNGLNAFSWVDGIFAPLGTLGGVNSQALGINDNGDVCGYSETGQFDSNNNPIERGFITVGGVMQALGTLGGSSQSFAYGINNAGNVTGNSNGRAFFHSASTGAMTALPPLNATWNFGIGYAIDENNVVVGMADVNSFTRHAVLWRVDPSTGQALETRDLGTLDDPMRDSVAYGISRAGHVVGMADEYFTNDTAFLWRDGVMTSLGKLPGFPRSLARGVNSDGVAVGWGYSLDPHANNHRAFVYRNGTLQDLTSQMPAGWALYEAYAINDSGQIVGWGQAPYSSSRMLLLEPDRAPVAQDDNAKTAGNTAVSINVLANDSDPEADPLQIKSHTLPLRGTLTRSGGVFTYTPNPWSGGTDSFTYTIDDGYGATATATVTILVTAANVTSQLSITRDTPRLDRKTGRYTQTVTLKKSGAGSVPLPVSLVLDGLTSGVTLVGPTGFTAETTPAGSPYVTTSNGGDGLLSGKDSLKVTLTFVSSTANITYTPRVLSGAGPR